MNSGKKIGLVRKVLGNVALLVAVSVVGGCAYVTGSNDGVRSVGGIFNPCITEECRLNNDFFETLRHMTPYETLLANEPDKDGNSGEMPCFSCPDCYPHSNYNLSRNK